MFVVSGASIVACQAMGQKFTFFSPDAQMHNEVIPRMLEKMHAPRYIATNEEPKSSNYKSDVSTWYLHS